MQHTARLTETQKGAMGVASEWLAYQYLKRRLAASASVIVAMPGPQPISRIVPGVKSTRPSSDDLEQDRVIGRGGSGSLWFQSTPRLLGAASDVSG